MDVDLKSELETRLRAISRTSQVWGVFVSEHQLVDLVGFLASSDVSTEEVSKLLVRRMIGTEPEPGALDTCRFVAASLGWQTLAAELSSVVVSQEASFWDRELAQKVLEAGSPSWQSASFRTFNEREWPGIDQLHERLCAIETLSIMDETEAVDVLCFDLACFLDGDPVSRLLAVDALVEMLLAMPWRRGAPDLVLFAMLALKWPELAVRLDQATRNSEGVHRRTHASIDWVVTKCASNSASRESVNDLLVRFRLSRPGNDGDADPLKG